MHALPSVHRLNGFTMLSAPDQTHSLLDLGLHRCGNFFGPKVGQRRGTQCLVDHTRRLGLHAGQQVRLDVERRGGARMAQGAADHQIIRQVLKHHRGGRVAQIMKADLRQRTVETPSFFIS